MAVAIELLVFGVHAVIATVLDVFLALRIFVRVRPDGRRRAPPARRGRGSRVYLLREARPLPRAAACAGRADGGRHGRGAGELDGAGRGHG